jgi:hypothetical protein
MGLVVVEEAGAAAAVTWRYRTSTISPHKVPRDGVLAAVHVLGAMTLHPTYSHSECLLNPKMALPCLWPWWQGVAALIGRKYIRPSTLPMPTLSSKSIYGFTVTPIVALI